MSDRRTPSRPPRPPLAAIVVAALLPPLTLWLRAAADEWRSPALLPQRFGTRGVEAAFADASLAGEAIRNSLAVGACSSPCSRSSSPGRRPG